VPQFLFLLNPSLPFPLPQPLQNIMAPYLAESLPPAQILPSANINNENEANSRSSRPSSREMPLISSKLARRKRLQVVKNLDLEQLSFRLKPKPVFLPIVQLANNQFKKAIYHSKTLKIL